MHPYLSIVVASRNDNHGGDLLKRMQIFVTALLEQCRRHQLPAELIIVEWNPPADRPPLMEALRWPAEPTPCAVRIIEVPAQIHEQYAHSDGMALYQMIAKNVGIRRARGEFVLATNIDILFSDELMEFFAQRRLEPGRMYRVDRSDVSSEIPVAPVEEQLEWCRHHLIRINGAIGAWSVTPDGTFKFEADDIAPDGCGLTLGNGWLAREFDRKQPFRWITNDAEVLIHDWNAVLAIDVAPGPGLGEKPAALDVFEGDRKIFSTRILYRSVLNIPVPRGNDGAPVRLRFHVEGGGHRLACEPRPLNICVRRCSLHAHTWFSKPWQSTIQILRRLGRDILYPFLKKPDYVDISPDPLHLQACGDFTMLARQHWVDLRGYPEFDMFAMNLDSVLCLAAHYGGAKQQILEAPMRTYHIEHETGSGWTPEGEGQLFKRLEAKGVPWLHHTIMERWGFDMCRLHAPMIFNREDWGLANYDLKETQRPA